MRTKITEIKETYTARRRVRNADGTYEMKEVPLTRFKPVNYIEGWARFGGFMLDMVFILIFEGIIGFGIGICVALFGDISTLETQEFDLSLRVLTWLLIRPLFYIIFEGGFQATPAKLILGRVVVNEYGEKPSFGQILGRSYGRIVPFEAFSCFNGLGWHDSWSETLVLRKEDLKGLKLAIQLQEIGKPETMTNRETPIA
ncbi:MAG TPA: RDD family protein [Bacteroidia bacterium]